MLRRMRGALRNDRGQGMVEYIIIVALIALAAILAVQYFGGGVQSMFAKLSHTLVGDKPGATADQALAQQKANSARAEAAKDKEMKDFEK